MPHLLHCQLATHDTQTPLERPPQRASNLIQSFTLDLWQRPLATTSLVLVVARLVYDDLVSLILLGPLVDTFQLPSAAQNSFSEAFINSTSGAT
ncbi:hypothetical protein SISSUDRAFT_1068094 [Sistotremastrum suecicum HHB10207 ss-3]|uniref:Uncharacterized protein n=1 Tax=Sistotremastrum suecicum HHB10207 ss-3 TaxID=1314776 RepID=A0A165WFW5_9AGAM|nr:hypothetical protein SISSUDRAFT_1068094 [Sistotremastrum suecicum HHB10207 ss-3]